MDRPAPTRFEGPVIGLISYAKSLYDPGHAHVMLAAAHDLLAGALAGDARYESVGYREAQAQRRATLRITRRRRLCRQRSGQTRAPLCLIQILVHQAPGSLDRCRRVLTPTRTHLGLRRLGADH